MDKVWSRLFAFILSAIYLVLGFWIGIFISIKFDKIIAPTLNPIVFQIPGLFIIVGTLLLLLSILLALYLLYRADVLHLELLFVQEFIKKTLLLLSAGLSFGLTYWFSLQVFVLTILIIKKVY